MRSFAWLLLAFWLVGCAGPLGALFSKQTWSENYARMPGARSSVPAIIDGNPETIGKLKVPREARPNLGYTMIPTAQATITLPETKHIAKIVLLSDRMDGVKVYAYDVPRGQWKLIKDIKGNLPPRVEIRTSVRTNQIRLESRAIPARGSSSIFGRIFNIGPRDVQPPTLREVELYGLVEAK